MTCLGSLVVGEGGMRQGRDLMDNLFCACFSFLFQTILGNVTHTNGLTGGWIGW